MTTCAGRVREFARFYEAARRREPSTAAQPLSHPAAGAQRGHQPQDHAEDPARDRWMCRTKCSSSTTRPTTTASPSSRRCSTSTTTCALVHNTLGRGVVNAIRAGVAAARGEYVLIFAADEVGPVLAIDDMLALMEKGATSSVARATRTAAGGSADRGSAGSCRVPRTAAVLPHRRLRADATRPPASRCSAGSSSTSSAWRAEPVGWAVAFEMAIKAQLARPAARRGADRLDRPPLRRQVHLPLGPWTSSTSRWFIWGCWKLRLRSVEMPARRTIRYCRPGPSQRSGWKPDLRRPLG